MVPVGPTLAAWLDGRRGKLIRYRTETASHCWVDAAVPEYHERETWSIKRGYASGDARGRLDAS